MTATGRQEMWQIAGKTIAQIHHRPKRNGFREPPGLREARFKIEVPAGERATEFTRYEQSISWLQSATADYTIPGDPADDTDRDEQPARIGCRLPADNSDLMLAGEPAKSAIKALDAIGVKPARQAQSDHSRNGPARHGCHIAEAPSESLVTNPLGFGIRREVDSFDNGICLEKREIRSSKIEN